jgi:hypothetical protein
MWFTPYFSSKSSVAATRSGFIAPNAAAPKMTRLD